MRCDLRKQCLDVALDQCDEERCTGTCWHQVQKGRLCVTEDVHDANGHHQAEEVCNVWRVEVGAALASQTVIEAQQQGDENARNDDVSQTEHSKVRRTESIFE